MLKNFLYFAVMTIALENLCFSADSAGSLKTANRDYMALMQGLRGILYEKGTPEELRYMIDGCITAGITDRLYRNAQQPMAHISNFIPQKKLHVLLAYAFYAVGYYNWNSLQEVQAGLISLGINVEPNFDREFESLCALAFDKGTICQYKNNLEDVIRRTAKGLSFDDFLEERFYEPGEMQEIPQTCQQLYGFLDKNHGPSALSAALIKVCPEFKRKYAKKGTVQPVQFANFSQSPVGMTSQPPSPLTVSTGVADSALQKTERYYTDTEIDAIGQPFFGMYKNKKTEKDPAALRAYIKMMSGGNKSLTPKYEGE